MSTTKKNNYTIKMENENGELISNSNPRLVKALARFSKVYNLNELYLTLNKDGSFSLNEDVFSSTSEFERIMKFENKKYKARKTNRKTLIKITNDPEPLFLDILKSKGLKITRRIKNTDIDLIAANLIGDIIKKNVSVTRKEILTYLFDYEELDICDCCQTLDNFSEINHLSAFESNQELNQLIMRSSKNRQVCDDCHDKLLKDFKPLLSPKIDIQSNLNITCKTVEPFNDDDETCKIDLYYKDEVFGKYISTGNPMMPSAFETINQEILTKALYELSNSGVKNIESAIIEGNKFFHDKELAYKLVNNLIVFLDTETSAHFWSDVISILKEK